jgi:hypothetical protein
MNKTVLKATTLVGLAALGAGYFGGFSQLNLPFNFENYLMLVPIQLGVLVYFFLQPTPHKLPEEPGSRPASPDRL